MLRNLGSYLNCDSCVQNRFKGDKTLCREIRRLRQWSRKIMRGIEFIEEIDKT